MLLHETSTVFLFLSIFHYMPGLYLFSFSITSSHARRAAMVLESSSHRKIFFFNSSSVYAFKSINSSSSRCCLEESDLLLTKTSIRSLQKPLLSVRDQSFRFSLRNQFFPPTLCLHIQFPAHLPHPAPAGTSSV